MSGKRCKNCGKMKMKMKMKGGRSRVEIKWYNADSRKSGSVTGIDEYMDDIENFFTQNQDVLTLETKYISNKYTIKKEDKTTNDKSPFKLYKNNKYLGPIISIRFDNDDSIFQDKLNLNTSESYKQYRQDSRDERDEFYKQSRGY